MWIATAAEMREIERRTIDDFGISAETLMENAGKAVFQKLQEVSDPGASVLVVCGKGNNGGDGFVVARLAHTAGFHVTCVVTASESELGELCRLQMTRAKEWGIQPQFVELGLLDEYYDFTIDAILGIGLVGEPTGSVAEAIDFVRTRSVNVIAVDVPSGIESDTGLEKGLAVRAKWTVTFGLPKPFLFQGAAPDLVGDWSVAGIGFPPDLLKTKTAARYLDGPYSSLGERATDSNKGENGHVLVLAGSRKYRGAASLATLGALKAGAGLVTVASIEPVIDACAAQIPEAIFLPLPERNGAIDASAADIILAAKDRFTSCVIGPGLTTQDSIKDLLNAIWRDWWLPNVIDADALNLVAEGLELPKGLCILTPHPGEAARLLGTDTKTIQADRFGSARAIQAKFGWPVVLKGAYSVGSVNNKPLCVNSTGNPGMATGGMGDVLAGVIATLLPDPDAGVLGMYWHGLAGDLAAKEIGEIGYSASDLAQFLPRARSILTT